MINTIQTAEPLPRAFTKLYLLMGPASQAIFSKGHQVLKSIRKQENKTKQKIQFYTYHNHQGKIILKRQNFMSSLNLVST